MTNPVPVITYTPCDSSQIAAYGYDDASQTLGLEFPGKGPVAGPRYHYHGFSPELYAEFLAAESKGKFFGAHIRGKLPYEKQPDEPGGVVFGLPQAQSSKYTTATATGRITVRATGKPIPDDEPVFILRASDRHAVDVLDFYSTRCDGTQSFAAEQVAEVFQQWANANPGRMKEPDTTVAA